MFMKYIRESLFVKREIPYTGTAINSKHISAAPESNYAILLIE
jgi:hypothetical protein